MNLKWFVIFIVINIVSCMNSIQKIPPKYNIPLSNPDVTLTLPSDKNSFPDVIYPTSILDIAKPFYFNTDDNYEVLGPFSEDVKSSYKLLSLINKPASKKSENDFNNKTEINKIVTTVTDAVMKEKEESEKENIIEGSHNGSKEDCVISFVLAEAIETENTIDFILDKTVQYYDYNVSLPQEVNNESFSKTPLHVKIDIQVFKERSNKTKQANVIEITNHLSSQDNEENTELLKQVTDIRNGSSEEIESSSEENYTELQDIKHSDFIKMLSVLLLDLLISTDNVTSEMWNTTLIENESLERIVLESIENFTNSESFGLMELNSTVLAINRTHNDFESMLNFTEPFGHSDGESIKDSKEEYFLDFLISLDSLCEINNTVETVAVSEYLTNHEYLSSENFTII